jgi:flagellar hook assembly protein FlgD
VPDKFATSRSYPNPFSTTTQIEFDIPKTDYLKVDIYDVHGKYVRNLFLGPQFAGTSVVTWDGTNQFNRPMPNGMYIYRIYYDGLIKGGKILYAR